jgi:hypothetical protein
MPNPTPLRAVRIPDKIWAAAQAKAATDGVTVSAVLRNCLTAWIAGDIDPM